MTMFSTHFGFAEDGPRPIEKAFRNGLTPEG